MISSSGIIKEACGLIIIVLNYACCDFLQCNNNNSREYIDRFQRWKHFTTQLKKNMQHINARTKTNGINIH